MTYSTENIDGKIHYVGNKVIQYIFAEYNVDLDKIAKLTSRRVLPLADVQQFYRLLGYSVEGWEELFGKDTYQGPAIILTERARVKAKAKFDSGWCKFRNHLDNVEVAFAIICWFTGRAIAL